MGRTIIYRPDSTDIYYFTTAVNMLVRNMGCDVEQSDEHTQAVEREAALSKQDTQFSPHSTVADIPGFRR